MFEVSYKQYSLFDTNMASATDIITYIGIPLAVLGVLPIIYTCITSLITLRSIKHKLKADGVRPLSITSSLMSGVVELTLPRYSITPLNRDEDPEYWKLSRRPSGLQGGTWTKFNWNCLVTGSRLYRLQYSDELQVPKAEVNFEELLSFLIDRGAVPDVKGLHMLRMSGLWTPTGTSLMLSPDTTQKALRVDLPDDSDGWLSLTMTWESVWDNFDGGLRLRPGWMRVGVPEHSLNGDEKSALKLEIASSGEGKKDFNLEKTPTQEFGEDGVPVRVSYAMPDVNAAAARTKLAVPPAFVRLRFSGSGSALTISDALWEYGHGVSGPKLPLSHLQKPPASLWVPSIALSLGLGRSMPLYNHSLDASLKVLANRDTIPSGVLVMLDIIPESAAPSWETKYDSHEDQRNIHAQFLAKQRAINAENKMSPEQASIARSKRQMDELQAMSDGLNERRRRDRERHDKRGREAVASPRLEPGVVTTMALKWLTQEKHAKPNSSLPDAIETVLFEMIQGDEKALSVCDILEKWRSWNERGGMTIDDVDWLADRKPALCNAVCVMGLLNEVCTKEESTVAADIRECVQHWNKVRLG